jgi:hypothetical protein
MIRERERERARAREREREREREGGRRLHPWVMPKDRHGFKKNP